MEKLRRMNRDISDMVLAKLEVKNLLQMKCVSREWRSQISDHSFKLHHSMERLPKLSGFLFQPTALLPTNVPSNVSFISTDREPAKLLSSYVDFIPGNFIMVCSCNGLVCCKSVSHGIGKLGIHVGNPVTREWIDLDWNVGHGAGSVIAIGVGLIFNPALDIVDGKTNFKVVIMSSAGIEEDEEGVESEQLSFHMYDTRKRSWKKSEEACVTGMEYRDGNCVSIEGVLYWLNDENGVLAFDVGSEVAYEISAPIPALALGVKPVTCIGESDGVLQYVMVSSEGLLIWGLEGSYYEEKWSLWFTKSLVDIENEHAGFGLNLQQVSWSESFMNVLAFKDGKLVLRVGNTVFLYNARTGGMDRVAHASELGTGSLFKPTVLPYSLSLAPLNQP